MTRVSTAMIPMAALADLSKAQQALVESARQSSAQTKASDLKGYGREAQTLVSAERLLARTEGFVATGKELRTRMELQDVALGRAADIVAGLKEELFQNVGLKDGDGVRSKLEEAFAVIKDAMNTTLGGNYLFGGVLNDRPPVTAATLSDLAANPIASSLEQGASAQVIRIEESRTLNAGVVADDFITEALTSLRNLAIVDEGANGPFDGTLTDPQLTALQTELDNLSTAFDKILQAQSLNGQLLNQVDAAIDRQGKQVDTLNTSIGDIVDVDLAEVAVNLNNAKYAYESSASIFATIKDLSLLNYLS